MSANDFNATEEFSPEVVDRCISTDKFICDSIMPKDKALQSALEANAAAGLDNIDVAPNQGKLFYLFAKLAAAKNILEVGTLGGYSAIWFAKALPAGGKLVTLELDPKHAQVAEQNIKNAGFADKVDVRVGPALDSLKQMEAEGWGKDGRVFDLVFVDADKPSNWEYVEYAIKFARVGTTIIVDNVGRKGRLADETFTEGPRGQDVVGTRRMFQKMGEDKRIEVSAVQTIGSKGWDGFAFAIVVSL